MASIYSIVYQPEGMEYDGQRQDYIRVPLQEANLITNFGIEGDQKGGHNATRQLNLLSKEWLDAQAAKGYRTQPGQFGEQIIITGLAVETLQPGDRLQLGQGACIEITKGRTGCERLEAAQGKSIAGLGALGVLARVVSGGKIAPGDPVTVVSPEASKV